MCTYVHVIYFCSHIYLSHVYIPVSLLFCGFLMILSLCQFLQPERIEGKAYGIHSEVWSLGISLFEVRYYSY